MNKFNFAVSRQVNPAGISPELTEEQVWKGLRLKVRQPQDFVPAITSCNVISEAGNKVSRSVVFRGGETAAREDIEQFDNTIVYFDGPEIMTRITNVMSYDADGQLVLTFSFANGIPGYNVPADGKRPPVEELNASVGKAVEHTLAKIRELVVAGKLN